jgi:hypothetical protein
MGKNTLKKGSKPLMYPLRELRYDPDKKASAGFGR